jgi:predicted nucleotidyltransferase
MVSMKEIRAVGRRIGRQFKPDKVILFGSYAYGKPTEDSDVDLLVVMPIKGDTIYKEVEIRMAVDIRFATDLLVRDPKVIRQRIGWNDFFLKEIMERGKVIYESSHRRGGGQGRRRFSNHAAGVSRA